MKYTIAFQGEHYAFSEAAAKQFLNDDAECVPAQSFEKVFELVVNKKVDLGIIPIENTLYGSIHRNFDLLLEHDVKIVGETNLRIELQLIALPGVQLNQIEKIYSHPAALEQCRRFLTKHQDITSVPTYDTAGSVKLMIEQNDPSIAAIASRTAAEDLGMDIICREIEDFPENFTRFYVISCQKHEFGLANKTSIAFSTKNIPGALFKSLSVFFLRDINLSKIESRPLKGSPWKYLFYLDFMGNVQDESAKNALAHLEEITDFIKILGSYPASTHHQNGLKVPD